MTASPTRMWWLWPRRFSAGIRFPSPLWARCGPPRRTGRWCWRRKAVEYCLLHGLGQSPADWAAVEAGLPGQKILCPDLAAWWADRPVTYESLLEGLEAQCAGSPFLTDGHIAIVSLAFVPLVRASLTILLIRRESVVGRGLCSSILSCVSAEI